MRLLSFPTRLHPFESEVVYYGFSTQQKASPQGHAKSHSLPYPSWLFAWAIEKCWRTRNTAPDNLMGNWLPRTAAQQGISCHKMARTAWQNPSPNHSLLYRESPAANRRRSLFPIPQNHAGIQLGSHTHRLVSFLKILKIVLSNKSY
jgi:hypothetical protein